MEELRYLTWGLIPVDTDPAAQPLFATNPPMLTAVAVDQTASLVFHLAEPPSLLQIEIEATSASSEGRGPSLFRVFTGSADDRFHELPHPGWAPDPQGLYILFTTRIQGAEQYLKLLYEEESALVVNRVRFTRGQ